MNGKYNLGIALKLLNLVFFTMISILIIKLNSKMQTLQLFAMICAFAVFFIMPWVIYTKGRFIKPISVTNCILRAAFNYLGMWSWIKALTLTSANDATALGYMSPIFTTVLAVLVCKEKLNYKCLIAILVSLYGAYIILRPTDVASISLGGMIALFSAAMWSCHDVVCKLQTKQEHPIGQALCTFVFVLLFSAPFVDWVEVPLIELPYIALIGLLSVLNVVVLFLAYKNAPLTILMPFGFLRLLFMALATFIFLGEIISAQVVLGCAIIIPAVSYIFIEQQRKARNSYGA